MIIQFFHELTRTMWSSNHQVDILSLNLMWGTQIPIILNMPTILLKNLALQLLVLQARNNWDNPP
jgi:hypothetical protein